MSEFREALKRLVDAVEKDCTVEAIDPAYLSVAFDRAKALLARESVEPAAAEKAREWRPIETAPKDGTRVELWGIGKVCGTGIAIYARNRSGSWRDDAGNVVTGLKLTHWRDEPSPPAATGETE